MREKPWQIVVLVAIYIMEFLAVFIITLPQIKHWIEILFLAVSFIFLLPIFFTIYVRRLWTYVVNIIFILPICILSIIVSLFIPMLLLIFAFPIVLFLSYIVFCSATRIYFEVKKEKVVSEKQHFEIEEPNEIWECPNCKSSNINTKYKCEECGYSIL